MGADGKSILDSKQRLLLTVYLSDGDNRNLVIIFFPRSSKMQSETKPSISMNCSCIIMVCVAIDAHCYQLDLPKSWVIASWGMSVLLILTTSLDFWLPGFFLPGATMRPYFIAIKQIIITSKQLD